MKHALLLVGDASAGISVTRRELVLKKISTLFGFDDPRTFPRCTTPALCKSVQSHVFRGMAFKATTSSNRPDHLTHSFKEEGVFEPGEAQAKPISHGFEILSSNSDPRGTSEWSTCWSVFKLFPDQFTTKYSNDRSAKKLYLPVWKRMTQDPWVLQVVQGYQLELLSTLVQQGIHSPRVPLAQQTVLDQEVQSLLDKRAVHRVQNNDPAGFISLWSPKKMEGTAR